MTPNPTSEPELEAKPVATPDVPETSTEAAPAATAAMDEPAPTAETTDESTAIAPDDKPVPAADEAAGSVAAEKSTPAVDEPTTAVATDEAAPTTAVATEEAAPTTAVATEEAAPTVAVATDEAALTTAVATDEPTPAAVDDLPAATVVDEPAASTTEVPGSEALPVYAAVPEGIVLINGTMPIGQADAEDDDESADLDESAVPPTGPSHYSTLVPLVSVLVGVTLLFALLIAAFALPAVHSGPNKLPVGVAGPATITPQLKQIFAGKQFDVTVYPSDAALRKAVKDDKALGGLSVNGNSASMLVSSAGSFDAALQLSQFANSLGSQSQSQIAIDDVVPLPKKDPRGLGIAALGLPLALGSLLPGIALFLLYRRRVGAQLAGVLGASVLIGLAVAAVLDFGLGSTKGSNYFTVSLAIAAGVAAISLVLLGLGAVAGRIGLGIGAAVILLISAPLSGLASSQYWLAHPWGTIGQLLPSGAASTLLRSVAFFHWHGSGAALLVLAGWALIGLLLLVLGNALITDPADDQVIERDDLAEIS